MDRRHKGTKTIVVPAMFFFRLTRSTVIVSQTAEYALRAVIRLAQLPGQAQTTQQLAAATLVPQSYLPKVLQPLARAGMVLAQRGSHGGYKLRPTSDAVNVLDVVNCVDPFDRLESCPGHPKAEQGPQCGLHRLLDSAQAEAEKRFAQTTIRQLIESPDSVPPLCSPVAEQSATVVETPANV